MNDVEELRRFVVVHARAQNLTGYERILDRIHSDDGDQPGSWVREWTRAAERPRARDQRLEASRYHNMARFPFVDGPARARALERCVDSFAGWAREQRDIERLDLDLPGGRVRCWTTGLSSSDRRPLLLVMAGIVTVKEQWAPVLLRARRLGMAGVVTELPRVGENTLRYDAESWRMISSILDAVDDRADVAQTYAVALSFAGHLALRCAVEDHRIRGMVTAGAPVRDFFTDTAWQHGLPKVTVDTLAHLTGTPAEDLPETLRGWALTDSQLDALDIPVCAVASRRDEIIPAGDVRLLREHLRHLRVVENDDVHGSPNHVAETRLWTVLSILRMRHVHSAGRLAVGAAWQAARARTRLARNRPARTG